MIKSSETKYLEYKIEGLNGLNLVDNSYFKVNNSYIKSIFINNNLTLLTVVLNDDIKYTDKQNEIENYLDHIFFNLITKTDAEISNPLRKLVLVSDGSEYNFNDYITAKDSFKIDREINAVNLYQTIVNSPTAVKNRSVLYQRIYNTLLNPNLIAQFMSLYQLLLELLSKEKKNVRQKNVTDHFKNHKEKYPFITFTPSRKKVKDYEDCFTYIRNEIGHCENTNDMALYQSLGSKITPNLIKQLISVLNDVIMKS